MAIPAVVLILALPAIIYLGGTDEMRYLATPLVYAGAGILTITGLLILYHLYGKRDTYRSIHTLALGFLIGSLCHRLVYTPSEQPFGMEQPVCKG